MNELNAIYTIWLRNMKRYYRSKSRIITSLVQPLFFLFVLGFGLGSAFKTGDVAGDYVGFLIPGVVAMSVLFSAVFSGIQVIWDKQFGFLKETLVSPVSRTSIMLGQALGGATVSFLQGFIILVIAIFIYPAIFSFPGILLALVFMFFIGLAFTSLGIAIASRMEDMQGFQLIINFVIFPLFFLSGALFPISIAPQILRTITYFDPLTYGVEGVRWGLSGVSQINPIYSSVVIIAFAVIMIFIGVGFFRKIKF